MGFSRRELVLLDGTQEVEIETRREGRSIRTVIWVVVHDEEVFVRSVRGESGKWYQRALANPEVALHVDGETIEARAVPASDPTSVQRVSDALRAKYRPGGSLDSMLRPEVLETTVRLDPV